MEDRTSSRLSTVLSFFCNHRRKQGGQGSYAHPNFYHILSFCALTRSVPNKILLLVSKSRYLIHRKKFGLAALLPVTTFIQTAFIFFALSHVPQYHSFHTACAFLLDVQSSTDKKLATTQDRQTLQNTDEKQYSNSYIT